MVQGMYSIEGMWSYHVIKDPVLRVNLCIDVIGDLQCKPSSESAETIKEFQCRFTKLMTGHVHMPSLGSWSCLQARRCPCHCPSPMIRDLFAHLPAQYFPVQVCRRVQGHRVCMW